MSTPIVVNKHAGALRSKLPFGQSARLHDWVAQKSEQRNFFLVSGRQIEATLGAVIAQGHRRIAVGGGDGTLSTAAALCTEHQIELVPFPMGTMNHFALDLGIDVDPQAWDALLNADTVHHVDLGQVDGRTFINNFSIGLYPTMAKLRREFAQERVLGSKRLATALSATKARFLTEPMNLSLMFERTHSTTHRELDCDALMVANNAYHYNAPLSVGREDLSGGCLVAYVISDIRRVRLTELVAQLMESGRLEDAFTGVDVVDCERISVRFSKRRVRAAIDGELVRLTTEISAAIRPQALRVVAPHTR